MGNFRADAAIASWPTSGPYPSFLTNLLSSAGSKMSFAIRVKMWRDEEKKQRGGWTILRKTKSHGVCAMIKGTIVLGV